MGTRFIIILIHHLKHPFKTRLLIVSAEEGENMYRLLGALPWNIGSADRRCSTAVRIDWVYLGGYRFEQR